MSYMSYVYNKKNNIFIIFMTNFTIFNVSFISTYFFFIVRPYMVHRLLRDALYNTLLLLLLGELIYCNIYNIYNKYEVKRDTSSQQKRVGTLSNSNLLQCVCEITRSANYNNLYLHYTSLRFSKLTS